MQDFYDIDVRYLGVCCGDNPMLIREVADLMGRTPPMRFR